MGFLCGLCWLTNSARVSGAGESVRPLTGQFANNHGLSFLTFFNKFHLFYFRNFSSRVSRIFQEIHVQEISQLVEE